MYDFFLRKTNIKDLREYCYENFDLLEHIKDKVFPTKENLYKDYKLYLKHSKTIVNSDTQEVIGFLLLKKIKKDILELYLTIKCPYRGQGFVGRLVKLILYKNILDNYKKFNIITSANNNSSLSKALIYLGFKKIILNEDIHKGIYILKKVIVS